MRLERVQGRSAVLGSFDLELPAGMVAVVARDARSLGAFVRALRQGLLGISSDEEPVAVTLAEATAPQDLADLTTLRMGLGGNDDAGEVLQACSQALARLRGGARLDDALGRLDDRHGDGASGRPRPGEDPQRLRERVLEMANAPSELRTLETELRELRADHAEVAGDVEVATMAWLRERQDAETHLQAYRDRARELKSRLTQLEAAGAESPCPTCGRLLRDRFDEVVVELREEWESVVQDGSWWKRRREQLDFKPDTLQELEGRSLRLQAATGECAERAERMRSRVQELEEARAGLMAVEREGPPGAGAASDEPVPTTVARAIDNVRRRMVEEAAARIVELGGPMLVQLTGSRLLGLDRAPSGLSAVSSSGPIAEPVSEDRSAAVVAIRLGAAVALHEDGRGLPGFIVLDGAFDRMGDEARLSAVTLLRFLHRRIPQVLIVTRGDVVDQIPEVFDSVFELRSGDRMMRGRDEGPRVRALPAGIGRIRIV